jgi:membrane-associated protease RseP (regulator of RpoE activity)
MLDILIRDGSDNSRSLDDVLRQLYQTIYKQRRGFTATDWWPTVSKAAGGRGFTDFYARYVDGRDPYPLDRILPLAGMRTISDTVREPRLGIASVVDSAGIVVAAVQPGSVAEEAGIQVGDQLLELGDLSVSNPNFGPAFRARFGGKEGAPLPFKIKRGADTLVLNGKVRLVARLEQRVVADAAATPKAVRIRNGILKGTTGK